MGLPQGPPLPITPSLASTLREARTGTPVLPSQCWAAGALRWPQTCLCGPDMVWAIGKGDWARGAGKGLVSVRSTTLRTESQVFTPQEAPTRPCHLPPGLPLYPPSSPRQVPGLLPSSQRCEAHAIRRAFASAIPSAQDALSTDLWDCCLLTQVSTQPHLCQGRGMLSPGLQSKVAPATLQPPHLY